MKPVYTLSTYFLLYCTCTRLFVNSPPALNRQDVVRISRDIFVENRQAFNLRTKKSGEWTVLWNLHFNFNKIVVQRCWEIFVVSLLMNQQWDTN